MTARRNQAGVSKSFLYTVSRKPSASKPKSRPWCPLPSGQSQCAASADSMRKQYQSAAASPGARIVTVKPFFVGVMGYSPPMLSPRRIRKARFALPLIMRRLSVSSSPSRTAPRGFR